ncbi:hypothetical protein YC2023_002821 [Brassica napus]
MGSSVITSLSLSFKQVPPTAVPAFLDSVLSSTGVSPSTLFESLIKELPFRAEKFTSDDCNHIASLVSGLCHLLKSFGLGTEDNHNALQLFMWRVFVPLMKMVRVCLIFPSPCYFQGILFSVFSEDLTSRERVHNFKEWLQENNMGMLQEAVLGWINRGLSSGSWTDGTESYVLEKGRVEFDFRSEHELVLGRNQERLDMAKVFDESLVRKESLHILKSVLSISEASKTISGKNCMALLNLLC